MEREGEMRERGIETEREAVTMPENNKKRKWWKKDVNKNSSRKSNRIKRGGNKLIINGQKLLIQNFVGHQTRMNLLAT